MWPAILILLASGVIFVISIASGFLGALSATMMLKQFCSNILVMCLENLHVLKLIAPWAGIAIMASGIGYAVFKALKGMLGANKTMQGLSVAKRQGLIVLIEHKAHIAFTHGFFRPKIYLSTGLLKGLSSDELKAVFMHELHHLREKDPLKFILINLLKDALFYLPLAPYVAGRIRLKKECAADDLASKAVAPITLASAIIKAAQQNNVIAMQASISGEKNTIEIRIKRLLSDKDKGLSAPSRITSIASVIIGILLFGSILTPIGADFSASQGNDCKRHCEITTHKH